MRFPHLIVTPLEPKANPWSLNCPTQPGGGRWKNTHRNGPEDLHSLSALVHFMVLEKLDLISAEAVGVEISPVGDVGFWASGEDVDFLAEDVGLAGS